MDYHFYQQKFQEALDQISLKEFNELGLKISVETILESVALKIYKPEWSSDPHSPLGALSRIFFSIWVSGKTIEEGRLYYNIHALKLRELKGYTIESRRFAEDFRNKFIEYQKEWDNVSVKFGPLTLMQGWRELKTENLQRDIIKLSYSFLEISPIIDETLSHFKI
ncbi:hypothetical protein [Chryseobacterium polytrichastri]|uniref:Uncharacterized protein n=1 Tax=Chryseobacterium polytrichastri TaxID=1302687 RepID=A0A1M7DY09_9FLAO|nr:hypothetical protein [Chryseobacterium polytrichastri]SHL84382.1 hypothetical protein SAMN05444267_102636 [Chryseobacterium polytrichastri]